MLHTHISTRKWGWTIFELAVALLAKKGKLETYQKLSVWKACEKETIMEHWKGNFIEVKKISFFLVSIRKSITDVSIVGGKKNN